LLYADDLVIIFDITTCKNPIKLISNELQKFLVWCEKNNLLINYSKSKVMYFKKAHDSSDFTNESLSVRGNQVEKVQYFRYLGVFFDEYLSFFKHFLHVESKISTTVAKIHSIKRLVPTKVFVLLVKSLVISHIDFCLSTWGCQIEAHLSRLQKRVDKLLLSSFFPARSRAKSSSLTTPVSPLLLKYNFFTVPELYTLSLLKSVAKVIYVGSNVVDLNDWFHVSPRNTRFLPLLVVPSKLSRCSNNSPQLRAITKWNNSPRNYCTDLIKDNLDISYAYFLRCAKELIKSKRCN